MLRLPILTLLIALAVSPAVLAADLADGSRLVQDKCAACHAVEPRTPSPHQDAPPFADVANRYKPEDLAEAFAEGIVVGHPDMPEFTLTPNEIDALIAYLESLRR